jgi:hypothetical protein
MRKSEPAMLMKSRHRQLPGKLDPSSPWLRCLFGPIIANERPTPHQRRGPVARTVVLLKGRQIAAKPCDEDE